MESLLASHSSTDIGNFQCHPQIQRHGQSLCISPLWLSCPVMDMSSKRNVFVSRWQMPVRGNAFWYSNDSIWQKLHVVRQIICQGISKGTAEMAHGASAPMQKHHKKAHKLYISSMITNVFREHLMPPALTFLLQSFFFPSYFILSFFITFPFLHTSWTSQLSYQTRQ